MGGVKLLNHSKTSKNKYSAFSLIELSIVLIIIGLLVAGVTGGASLIESAKIRATINEAFQYRTALNTFRAANDRLPGDVDDDGCFGEYSSDIFTGFFPAPYDGSKYPVPNQYTGVFVDLYLAGIIDFQPINTTTSNKHTDIAKDGGLPFSKGFNDLFLQFISKCWTQSQSDFPFLFNIKNHVLYYNYRVNKNNIKSHQIAKKIDNKIDDNSPLTGNVRASCPNNKGSYQNYDLMSSSLLCDSFVFVMDF